MKVTEDNGYVEIRKSDESGKVLVIIQAKDSANPLKTITNCVEITVEQYKQLISDV
jgi:hypothetical protein